MKLEDVQPAHCYARAQRLLAEVTLVREELGRPEDGRPVPEVTGAHPREVYFEAIASWRKAERLAREVGVRTTRAPDGSLSLRDIRPGHVLRMIDSVLAEVEDIKQQLQITERAEEPALEPARQPSDVLATLVRANRELSRALERPFAPSDVYQAVAQASALATRLGAVAAPAAHERRKRPVNCYEKLSACLTAVAAKIEARGEHALAARGTPPDVLPGDVYDLASLVLGEVAYLHALAPDAAALHAFEPGPTGYRTPSDVYQLASTLESQLAALP